ncbi:MAG TPA: acyltransferase [Ktedonobacteraceae bacterium]|nr:acyltransferase [Ktedonobacteraceae bacterium]
MSAILQKNNQKNTIAVLDGVRALACLSVIAFHISLISISTKLWQPYPSAGFLTSAVAMQGGSGVTLFFVLSGFLLFLPFAKALLFERDWPSIRRFYLRRILRIWPAYYLTLLLIVLFIAPEWLHADHLSSLGFFLTFFMDSSKSTFQQLNGPFWTLAIEWQYYMLLPLIALALRFIVAHGPIKRRWWLLVACLGILMAWGIFSRFLGTYLVQHPNVTLLLPRSVLNVILFFVFGMDGKFMEDFAVGMLVSGFFVLAQQQSPKNTLYWLGEKARRYCYWLWGTGIVVLTFMTVWNGNERFPAIPFLIPLTEAYNWFSEWGLSLGFGLCIMGLLFGTFQLKRLIEWGPLRWIGLISFSMYMWHLPLLNLFTRFLTPYSPAIPDGIEYLLYWLFVALIVIPIAYILYRLIEQPGVKLGERLWQRWQSKPQVERHESKPEEEPERSMQPSLSKAAARQQ